MHRSSVSSWPHCPTPLRRTPGAATARCPMRSLVANQTPATSASGAKASSTASKCCGWPVAATCAGSRTAIAAGCWQLDGVTLRRHGTRPRLPAPSLPYPLPHPPPACRRCETCSPSIPNCDNCDGNAAKCKRCEYFYGLNANANKGCTQVGARRAPPAGAAGQMACTSPGRRLMP